MRHLKFYLGVLVIIIAYFSMYFFSRYHGTLISNSWIYSLASIALIYIGYWIIKMFIKSEDQQMQQLILETQEYIQDSWDKHEIELIDFKVKSNNYTEEIEKIGYSRYEALDALSNPDKFDSINIVQSVVMISAVVNGKKKQFKTEVISKEKATLEFILSGKKFITVYINPKDNDEYYFDLSFLD